MPEPLSEYFTQEAGEFLDRMDALLAGSEAPDPVEFFRLARGVRGSAQLAGAHGVAEVAERLEDGARALRDGALPWSDELRERARASAADLRALVAAYPRWGAEEAARAGAAAERWSGVGAGRRRGDRPGREDALFAFVQHEIGGVAVELDRVLAAAGTGSAGREPLRLLLRRMRPVRGVVGIRALAPVLEVLEGVEDAAHTLLGTGIPAVGPRVDLLRGAAAALRAAEAELRTGTAPGESPELTAFRSVRERADDDPDASGVLPLSRLFPDDGASPLVSSPHAPVPAAGATVEAVEGFVAMEATGFLDRAEGVLAESAAGARGTREAAELAASVGELAVAFGLRELAGAAARATRALREGDDPVAAGEALRRLRSALPGAAPIAAAPRPAPPSPLTPPATGREPAEPGAKDAEVVPVESLLYAPDDALREALALRGRIEAIAPEATGRTPLAEALDELFGLVELGLAGRA